MFHYMSQGAASHRNVVRPTLPILLQNLHAILLGLIDTLMVGALEGAPLVAVLVVSIPVFVIQLVTFGLQSGSSILISQFWDKGDTKSTNRVIGLGCYMAGAIPLALASVMLFLSEQLMSPLTDSQELVPLTAQYACIVGPSYTFNSLIGVYVDAHRSMENPKLGMIIFGMSMPTDAFLNWMFIFGNLGASVLGVVGMAVTTLSTHVLEFVIIFSYALTNRRLRPKPAMLFRPGRALLAKFFHYSRSVVLNETPWGPGISLYKVIVDHMKGSTRILAARALTGNIEDFCTVAISAIDNTTVIIVGRETSASRQEHVYGVGATLDTLAFLCGLIIGIPLILGAWFVFPWLVYPFSHLSGTADSITTTMLTFIGVFLTLWAFGSVNTVGVLRGGGDVRAATIIDTTPLRFVSLLLVALFGLVFQWGIFWVCMGIMAEQSVKFDIGLYRLHFREWVSDVAQSSRTE